MSFKYGLVSLRYSLIDRVFFLLSLLSYSIIAVKVAYSYLFVKIFFFLKNVLNTSNYSALICIDYLVFSLFFNFVFLGVFFTSINIVDTCWFTLILGCVCFKKGHHFGHNFIFNITSHTDFLQAREYS